MIHLELQPDVESQLAAEAQARGLSLDRYIESIVTERTPRSAERVAGAIAEILRLREDTNADGLDMKEIVNEGRKF